MRIVSEIADKSDEYGRASLSSLKIIVLLFMHTILAIRTTLNNKRSDYIKDDKTDGKPEGNLIHGLWYSTGEEISKSSFYLRQCLCVFVC